MAAHAGTVVAVDRPAVTSEKVEDVKSVLSRKTRCTAGRVGHVVFPRVVPYRSSVASVLKEPASAP